MPAPTNTMTLTRRFTSSGTRYEVIFAVGQAVFDAEVSVFLETQLIEAASECGHHDLSDSADLVLRKAMVGIALRCACAVTCHAAALPSPGRCRYQYCDGPGEGSRNVSTVDSRCCDQDRGPSSG